MVRSVRVPAPFEPLFESAEQRVEQLFTRLERKPERGTIHVGGDRYLLVRAESLFLGLFDALEQSFGWETASEFIYNTAREIGKSDSLSFATRLDVTDPVGKLAAGPVHFAYAGWARVEILDDSAPAPDSSCYLHYYHPNTFESEVTLARGVRSERPVCLFSAGYSAGWCSHAFGVELHSRELHCLARGDSHCEFVMATSEGLEERVRKGQ